MVDNDNHDDDLPSESLASQLQRIRKAVEEHARSNQEAAVARVAMASRLDEGIARVDALGGRMDEVVELLDSQDDTRPGLRRRVRELEQERERERDAREKRDKRVSQLVFGGGLINALILIAAVMVMGARISGVLEQLASVVKKG